MSLDNKVASCDKRPVKHARGTEMAKAKIRIVNRGVIGGFELFVTLPGKSEVKVNDSTSRSGYGSPCSFSNRDAAIRGAKAFIAANGFKQTTGEFRKAS